MDHFKFSQKMFLETYMKTLGIGLLMLIMFSCSENITETNNEKSVELEYIEGYSNVIDSITIQNRSFLLNGYDYSGNGKTLKFSLTNDSGIRFTYVVDHDKDNYKIYLHNEEKQLAAYLTHKNGWLLKGTIVNYTDRPYTTTKISFDYISQNNYSFEWGDSLNSFIDITHVQLECDENGNPKTAYWTDYETSFEVHFTFENEPNPYFHRIETLMIEDIMENRRSAFLHTNKTSSFNGQELPVNKAVIIRMPWLPVIAYNSPHLISSFHVLHHQDTLWSKHYDYYVDSIEKKIISFGTDNLLDTTCFYFSEM